MYAIGSVTGGKPASEATNPIASYVYLLLTTGFLFTTMLTVPSSSAFEGKKRRGGCEVGQYSVQKWSAGPRLFERTLPPPLAAEMGLQPQFGEDQVKFVPGR